MNELNIVFLDIDGVLQPYDSQLRFANINKEIIEELSIKFNTNYYQYNFYDVCAVYYDWEELAINRLKYILNETNSKIIVSSNWKSNYFPNKMKDLLKIHDLDKYWLCDNPIKNNIISFSEQRREEIIESLNTIKISNYVILDDMKELKDYFPNNSVITNNYISLNDMNSAIKILKKH